MGYATGNYAGGNYRGTIFTSDGVAVAQMRGGYAASGRGSGHFRGAWVLLCNDLPGRGVCEYRGELYPAGESFPAGDDCNSCFCTESGEIACTDAICVPPSDRPDDRPRDDRP